MQTISTIVVWAVFGLVVGALARALYPGRQPMGLGMTMGLGIAGSLVGGFISWAVLGGRDHGMFDGAGLFLSIVGALLVVWGAIALGRKKRSNSL